MLIRKSFEDVQQTAIKAEEPDLRAIRKYALRDVSADEIWLGSMKLCHDRPDRTHERFTKAYLERFAATLPGKSVLPGHDYSALPLGRFYAAEVVPDDQGHHLRVRYYLPKDSPLVPQIELGVLKDVSIGFNAGKRVCDVCEKAWDFQHEHFPGVEYDGKTCTLTYCESEAHKAEAMEGSFVWCGAQPGAEAVAMAAKQNGFGVGITTGSVTAPSGVTYITWGGSQPPAVRGANEMDLEQAKAEIERLKKLPLAAEREAELQKAIAEKEPLAKDGASYRQSIRDNILRMADAIDEADKHAGKAATKKDQYTVILSAMPADASAEQLLAVEKGLKSDFDARMANSAGHNNGPGDENENKTQKKSSPFGGLAWGGLR